MKKKMIAAIIACSMVMTSMPSFAFADEAAASTETSASPAVEMQEPETDMEEPEIIPEEMTEPEEMAGPEEIEAEPEMTEEPQAAEEDEAEPGVQLMGLEKAQNKTASKSRMGAAVSPSTSKGTAPTISFASGSTVSSTFTTNKYDHWYKFTLNNTRRIRMNLIYDGPYSMAYIYSASNTNSHIFCTSGNVDRYTYLSAGTYYLKISPSSYNNSRCTYWFRVISNSNVKDEISEPNDNIMYAANLAVNKRYSGALVKANANLEPDTDFVCYNTAKGTYKLNVKAPEVLTYGGSAGHSPGSIRIYAKDAYGNDLYIIRENGYDKKYVTISSGFKGSFTVRKPKGAIYFKVVSGSMDNVIGKYSIELVKMPGKTSNLKLKARSKSLKVTCKAVNNKTGYEVKYKKKSSSKWTKKRFAKNSFTLKHLKKKTKYVVKIRTYKKVNGKTYYSSWTSVKVQRTK